MMYVRPGCFGTFEYNAKSSICKRCKFNKRCHERLRKYELEHISKVDKRTKGRI